MGLTIGMVNPGFHINRSDTVNNHDGIGVDTGHLSHQSILHNACPKFSNACQAKGTAKPTPPCHDCKSLRSPALPKYRLKMRLDGSWRYFTFDGKVSLPRVSYGMK